MDSNNPAQAPGIPNVSPPATQPAVSKVQMPDIPSSSSNKVILWFIVGLVVIVLTVGGIYFFLNRQQAAPTQAPTTQASPSPAAQQNLESDLNNINVDIAGATSDFTAVDRDLQSL